MIWGWYAKRCYRLRKVSCWKTFRPEGHPIQYTLSRPWRIVWYLRKYRKKNYTASKPILDHFNSQRKLLSQLRYSSKLQVAPESAVKLAVVGDLMWVRTNWDGFLTPGVKNYLLKFDAVLGNLETPIDRTRPPAEWYKIDCAKFNSDEKLLTAFYDESKQRNIFTALATANNHSFDRGDSGAHETLKVLKELGILQSGLGETAEEAGPVLFECKNIKFGMYSTCYGYNDPNYKSNLHFNVTPGLAPSPVSVNDIDLSEIKKSLQKMEEEKVDFKILYIHWGHEFELYPTAVQLELGRKLAAMGFDLIAGSHSHVVQPSEVCFINGYEQEHEEILKLIKNHPSLEHSVIQGKGKPRKALIHYSLGNFITAMFYLEPKFGVIQGIEVFRSETGDIDWHLPETTIVYNALSMHNKFKKELLLIEDYFENNRRKIEVLYPFNLAACSYLYRHIHDTMSEEEIWRGPIYKDYNRVISILEEKGQM